MLNPVHNQLVARQREVDAHAEQTSLMLVRMLHVDDDAAGHDVGRKRFEFVRLRASTEIKRA